MWFPLVKYLMYILFHFYIQTLLRSYEADIEALNKQQKLKVEKAESIQVLDMKQASKKLKADQVCVFKVLHSLWRGVISYHHLSAFSCGLGYSFFFYF